MSEEKEGKEGKRGVEGRIVLRQAAGATPHRAEDVRAARLGVGKKGIAIPQGRLPLRWGHLLWLPPERLPAVGLGVRPPDAPAGAHG